MRKVYGNEKWQALGDKPGNDIIKNITNEGTQLLLINFIKQLIVDYLSERNNPADVKARNEVERIVKTSPLLEGFDRQAIIEYMYKKKNKKSSKKYKTI